MAWDTIDYCWGPSYVEGISYAVRALPLKHSFSRPQGIAKWAAWPRRPTGRFAIKQKWILCPFP